MIFEAMVEDMETRSDSDVDAAIERSRVSMRRLKLGSRTVGLILPGRR